MASSDVLPDREAVSDAIFTAIRERRLALTAREEWAIGQVRDADAAADAVIPIIEWAYRAGRERSRREATKRVQPTDSEEA